MKTLKFSFALTIMIAILSMLSLGSCSSDTPDKPLKSKTFSSYKIIGKYHNDNLDYIYNKLTDRIKDVDKHNKETLKKHITADFLAECIFNFANKPNDLNLIQYAGKMKKSVYPVISYYYQNQVVPIENGNTYFTENLKKYTKAQQEYIKTIINSPEINISDFQKNIENIMYQMEQDKRLNSEERHIIYISASIAYSSYEYWKKNITKWENLLGFKTNETRSFSWSTMWHSDVEGAVSGGIGGAITGGTVSMGAFTIPGWAAGSIGGAIGQSAANAIQQSW